MSSLDSTTDGSGDLASVLRGDRRYSGAAWPSRFLRAPKVAIELANRSDFVSLSALATVKLGLKTGADDFFFLKRCLGGENKGPSLLPTRELTYVSGKNGWQGILSKKDLRPAVLNPHQLFSGDDRKFLISKEANHFYLNPREGRLREGLSDYVRLGELAGVSSQLLVRSNSKDGCWYRQARHMVTSRWVLPYNSAYDYGAWRNDQKLVLNGRLLGVDAIDPQLEDIIGAVLNSTFALIGRLLEGVATGVEGAFDVGPPAARKMQVPDMRRFTEASVEEIKLLMEEIRRKDILPPAPSRNGTVVEIRRKLDTAILGGLGLSKGQAAVMLDKVYLGYARWRSNVEDVETQMRENRRAIQKSGQSRSVRPVEAAGKRVWEEICHSVKSLPSDLLLSNETLEVVSLPDGAVIAKERPLFEEGVIRGRSKSIDLKSFDRVRYVAVLQEIGLSGLIEVPTSTALCAAITLRYEKQKEDIVALVKQHAASYVSGSDAMKEVVSLTTKHWLNTCRIDVLKKQSNDQRNRKSRKSLRKT